MERCQPGHMFPGCLLLILLASLSVATSALLTDPEVFDSSEGGHEQVRAGRWTRASDSSSARCSYTFVVPQQKITGPICLDAQRQGAREGSESSDVTRKDVEEVRDSLLKQKRQIDSLQHLVEVDGGIVNEVKLLRKESRNMNSRVTQLYLQLLHEIIRKRDNSLEMSQLENKVLNQTAEMLKLAGRYRELEQKYTILRAMVQNQSVVIAWLEAQCRKTYNPRPPHFTGRNTLLVAAPNVPPIHRFPPTLGQLFINEIQRDQTQNAPATTTMTTTTTTLRTSTTKPATLPIIDNTQTSGANPSGPWRDCLHAWEAGQHSSGVYLIQPNHTSHLMQAWCNQDHDPGGWLVIQRRRDGSVNFFRNWENYKKGFGNLDGEYWLGLENILWLTNQTTYKLLVLMEDWQGRKVFAEYASFLVSPESDFYRLRLGPYSGNAGDSLLWHNGKEFTTLDLDRDSYTGNCAHFQKGGWWYNACAHSNLNGVWHRGGPYRSKNQDGVYWAEFRGGSYSLRKVVMMVRPNI
uniref:angiopoietin-related protein 2-like isoform X2 n=1 Tax=Myxine glutinosa TaxID=7769 RepID=UPI00358EB0C0